MRESQLPRRGDPHLGQAIPPSHWSARGTGDMGPWCCSVPTEIPPPASPPRSARGTSGWWVPTLSLVAYLTWPLPTLIPFQHRAPGTALHKGKRRGSSHFPSPNSRGASRFCFRCLNLTSSSALLHSLSRSLSPSPSLRILFFFFTSRVAIFSPRRPRPLSNTPLVRSFPTRALLTASRR